MTTAALTQEVTYVDAISQALDEEMSCDERVFLMGEDIGAYGGAFKVTEGFQKKYGEWRVLDTPISESGIVGAAIGAAMMGLRPVVEMQFADFISCAFDQITEVAAKNHYRWGAAVPMVIRAPFGGGVHGGPFHSECPEGWFFHSPGLKIVAPSTPYDAKGLLKAAIRDPNPVLYFEHKFLYRRIKAALPHDNYIVPIGKVEVKRTGSDISIITYGAMVHLALEAAEVLHKEGIELEVVDLRTLIPLDKETIYASVRKTSKAMMLQEDNKTGGIGAEISALLAEDC
ncbi:MAG: alpha-ketoacid dehydrogenase subunit beta, partial [Nitrospira sp.]